jgi:hypothetical protein
MCSKRDGVTQQARAKGFLLTANQAVAARR